jgi:hypothetical protein
MKDYPRDSSQKNLNDYYIKKLKKPKTSERNLFKTPLKSNLNISNLTNLTNNNNSKIILKNNINQSHNLSIMDLKDLNKDNGNIDPNSTIKKYIFRDYSFNYDQLKPNSDQALKDYRYNSLPKKDNLGKLIHENIKFEKTKLDKILEKQYHENYNKNFIKIINRKKNESYNEKNKTKILINYEDYDNPLKSFSTIKKNEVIYDSILKNYREVQKFKYNDYIKKVNELNSAQKSKIKNLKIVSIAPRSKYEYYKNTMEDQNQNLNNSQLNSQSNSQSQLLSQSQLTADYVKEKSK